MAETTELDTKFCKNCKRDISAGNFVMHEMHCMRNITLCKHCHEPVPKAEIDQHFEELHAKIGCEKCGKQVEKSHLEKHEEEECSKRPMRCTYCELETPQEELASHLEYCGTRTEECHKCGQFIMKKDEDRHETSKCTYPTPKPVPDNNSNRPIGGQEVLIPTFRNDPHYDPFVFDEMHRLLRPEDVLGAAGGTANPIVNDTRKEKMKFSKSKTNKKSEINKQRERVQNHRTDPVQNREPVNSQEEQDRLLAMHLAHDLNENDNIEDMIRQFDKPSLVTRGGQSRSFDRNMADGLDIEPDVGDSSLLPCEFCGVPFPLDDLVNHQSNCTDDPLSSLMPQINNRDDPGWSSGRVGDDWSSGIVAQETIPQELDNRLRSQDNSRQQPSVINNLDYGAVQNMYASDVTNTVIHGDEDDMFMLPCEFCNDLFPQDVLVQHQAVCEQPNSSLTSVQRTPKKQNTEPGVLTDRYNDTSHQQSSRSGHDEPPSWHLRDTLHKYGVEMKEPKVPSSRRYQGTHDSDEENQTTPRRLSQPRKTDSAARTRSTLNDLLTPDLPTSNINYLGHITKQKQSKDNVNVSRQNQSSRTTPTNVLRSTQGYVPTGARGDSRTSKLTNAVRGTRGDLEVNGSSPLDSRHSSRSTGSTLNSSSRTRNLPSNSVTSTRTTQERGSRTRPFDYGTNKNTRTPNRRYQDQF